MHVVHLIASDEMTNYLFLFTRRAALETWKQRLGSNATYSNLIGVFERAGYQGYADTVYKVLKESLPGPTP